MSNLYSITHSQEAMRRLFRVGHDLTSNLPPLPAVYPDTMGADCSHRTRWRELAFHIVLGLLAATDLGSAVCPPSMRFCAITNVGVGQASSNQSDCIGPE